MQQSKTENVAQGTIWKGQFKSEMSLRCVSGTLWLTRGNRDIILRVGDSIALSPHEKVLLQALGEQEASFVLHERAQPPKTPYISRLLWKLHLLSTKPAPL